MTFDITRQGGFLLINDAVKSHDRGAWLACNDHKEWVARLLAKEGSVRSLSGLLSPDGDRQLLVAEFTRGPWQLERLAVLLVVPQSRKILGQVVNHAFRGHEWRRQTSQADVVSEQGKD